MSRSVVKRILAKKNIIDNKISQLEKQTVYDRKYFMELEDIYNNILNLNQDVHDNIIPNMNNKSLILDSYYLTMKNFNDLLHKSSQMKRRPITSIQFELYRNLYDDPLNNQTTKDKIDKIPVSDIINKYYKDNFRLNYLDLIFRSGVLGLHQYILRYGNINLFNVKKNPGIFYNIEVDGLIFQVQIYSIYQQKMDRSGNFFDSYQMALKLPNDGFFYLPTSSFRTFKDNISRHKSSTWSKLDKGYIREVPEIYSWCSKLIFSQLGQVTRIVSDFYYNYEEERVDIFIRDISDTFTVIVTFEPESLPFYFTDIWLNKNSFR